MLTGRLGRVGMVTAADEEGISTPLTLVIVDDHPLFRAAIRQMLDGWPNLEVVGEASDGGESVELCRRLHPELVLMDLSMPNMDGFEATREIKQESPSTIVLVLTASEEPEYLLKALRAGASGYVVKHMGSQQIVGAIRK